MSIFVAVRVRPPSSYPSSIKRGKRKECDPFEVDDPSVCGTLRFVNDRCITFTQDAMERLEDQRSSNAGGGTSSPSQRSRTPTMGRASSSPLLSRDRSAKRASSPVATRRSSGTLSSGRPSSNPMAPSSTRQRVTRPVFEFDGCFSSMTNHMCFATQLDIYEQVGAPLLENLLAGYNCCLMAYGQTGSGKTYSMLGPHNEDLLLRGASTSPKTLPPRPFPALDTKQSLIRRLQHDEDRGLMLRISEQLFSELQRREAHGRRASWNALRQGSASPGTPSAASGGAMDASASMVKFELEATYYQIYRERVYCLLQSMEYDEGKSLKVRESATTGPYIEGLDVIPLRSIDDLIRLLERGTKHRRVASTHQNMHSSRSHAVLCIRLRCIRSTHDASFTSTMNLVDLAGSERTGRHGDSAARIAEASDINCSLSTLGKVIHVLSNQQHVLSARKTAAAAASAAAPSTSSGRTSAGGPRGDGSAAAAAAPATVTSPSLHVPYRESVLTFLLKDSIGGNSRTTILSAISPMLDDVAETLSTLRYSSKARHIVNTPVVNTDAKSVLLVATLREEVNLLRRQLQDTLGQAHHRDMIHLLEDKERQLSDYEEQMQHVEVQRAEWETEKVHMMEKLVLLEHEAHELRGELHVARETANGYRLKLQELTSIVDDRTTTRFSRTSDGSEVDQARPYSRRGSNASTTGTTNVTKPVFSIPIPNSLIDRTETLGSPLMPASARDDHQPLSSRAIVFSTKTPPLSSRRSNSPPDTGAVLRSQQAADARQEVSALSAPTQSPSIGKSTTPIKVSETSSSGLGSASISPRSSFVAGSRQPQQNGAEVGRWILPDRYQWLLQPSRSNSQEGDSNGDDDDEGEGSKGQTQSSKPTSVSTAVGHHTSSQRQAADNVTTNKNINSRVVLPPPPPMPKSVNTNNSKVSFEQALPSSAGARRPSPTSESDDDGLTGVDRESLIKAAEGAGIDIYAILQAKRREKKEKKRQLLATHSELPPQPATADSKGQMRAYQGDAASISLQQSKVVNVAPATGAVSLGGSALPPPAFVKTGAPPPQLTPFQLSGRTSVTSAPLKESRSTSREGLPPNGGPSSASVALERFRQRLTDSSPPAPQLRPDRSTAASTSKPALFV